MSEDAFHGSLWPRLCGPIHPVFRLLLPSLSSFDHQEIGGKPINKSGSFNVELRSAA